MQTIMVTGGAGFIGSEFVRLSIASTLTRVVNVDLLTYAGNLDSLNSVANSPDYIFCHGDIGDARFIRNILRQHQPVAIVNFAAESHVDRSIDSPLRSWRQTSLVPFRLLEETRRYWNGLGNKQQEAFRFLHVSTDEVYGSLGPTGKFSESTPYAPNSPYSASKAASDHFVRAYYHTYGCRS